MWAYWMTSILEITVEERSVESYSNSLTLAASCEFTPQHTWKGGLPLAVTWMTA